MVDRDAARTAKEHLRAHLSAVPGVGGVGLGRRHDDYVITVTVVEQSLCEVVPQEYEGVGVEVRVSGPVRALDASGGGTGPGPVGTGPDPASDEPGSGP